MTDLHLSKGRPARAAEWKRSSGGGQIKGNKLLGSAVLRLHVGTTYVSGKKSYSHVSDVRDVSEAEASQEQRPQKPNTKNWPDCKTGELNYCGKSILMCSLYKA